MMYVAAPHLLGIPEVVSTSVPPDATAPPTGTPENRYAMFAEDLAERTEHSTSIVVELSPAEAYDTLGLFDVSADVVDVTLTGGPSAYSSSQTIRYSPLLSPDFPNRGSLVFCDLPTVDPALYPSARLRVTLSVTDPRMVRCGLLVTAMKASIGYALYGTEVSITDFSRKDRDTFGNITLIERGYTEQIKYRLGFDTDETDAIRQLLADRRAVATIYIGATTHSETIAYGYYQDFVLPLEAYSYSVGDITVESALKDGAANYAHPSRAVFVTPHEFDCIDDDQGAYKKLCIVDGETAGEAVVTVLDRPLLPGETIEWEMTWVSGSSTVEPAVTTLGTDCSQYLSILTWPAAGPVAHAPGVASIRARIFDDQLTEIEVTDAVILAVDTCSQDDPCSFPPCRAQDYRVGWYNRATQEYDQDAVTGLVGQGDIRALAAIYDDVYYRANNPGIDEDEWVNEYGELYKHYALLGDSQDRKPNLYFDPAYYKAQNPDVVAALPPNVPQHFYNSLQHYQMFGYGEGRLPCADTSLFDIPTTPIGDFHWVAKAQAEWCSDGCCAVTWEQTWTGTEAPYVTVAGDTVTVTAKILDGLTSPAPVSTGVLTLTATVTCDGGTPVELDPITLTIGLYTAGWYNSATGAYTLQGEVGILGEEPDQWTAAINGDLTDCTPAYSWDWSGSNWPLVQADASGRLLSVRYPDEVGVLTVTPTVDCGDGVLTLPDIFLTITEDGVSGYGSGSAPALGAEIVVIRDGEELGSGSVYVTIGREYFEGEYGGYFVVIPVELYFAVRFADGEWASGVTITTPYYDDGDMDCFHGPVSSAQLGGTSVPAFYRAYYDSSASYGYIHGTMSVTATHPQLGTTASAWVVVTGG